jgi:hypothetical protein
MKQDILPLSPNRIALQRSLDQFKLHLRVFRHGRQDAAPTKSPSRDDALRARPRRPFNRHIGPSSPFHDEPQLAIRNVTSTSVKPFASRHLSIINADNVKEAYLMMVEGTVSRASPKKCPHGLRGAGKDFLGGLKGPTSSYRRVIKHLLRKRKKW